MILYKYLHPDRLDVLKNRRIRFTQPGDFNDPFEFRPQIITAIQDQFTQDYLEENFERLVEENLSKYGGIVDLIAPDMLKPLLLSQKAHISEILRFLDPQLVKAVSPRIDNILNNTVGILCLSEVRDSLLLWGHYTDNHRGLVIGFNSESPFFSKRKTGQDEFGFLRQVQYQRQRPTAVLTDTSSPVWFQTKSEEWSYEKEWRIARVLAEADLRINTGSFPVCLFEFPMDAVAEVIIGLRANQSMTQEIQSLISAFPRASLFQAKESPSEYRVLINQIDIASSANHSCS